MNITKPINIKIASVPQELPKLLATQQVALDHLTKLSDAAPVVFLAGERGLGKTTILRAFCERQGGLFIGSADVVAACHRATTELASDALTAMVEQAFDKSDLVVIDDLATFQINSIRGGDFVYQISRQIGFARDQGKKLVIGWSDVREIDWIFHASPHRVWTVVIEPFAELDYQQFLITELGDRSGNIDIVRLFRHASALSGHDLHKLCALLRSEPIIDTVSAIALLDRHILKSNTRIAEVEDLSFEDLPGAEHIAAKLETHVAMPLQNLAVCEQLDLRPKRGVLLYGPPGTGKTSIGRALAHRMRGKFFLIDGTIVTEPPAMFFLRINAIIKEAQQNAPCVLFIDDADVLFGIVHISGFARYLLTLLDGMESATANKVCVMMTAMDVTKVPSAILRSGRVELWLETRSPSAEIRAAILKKWIGTDLNGYEDIDYMPIAEQAEGFTPADLRRVTGDARAYCAADLLAGRPLVKADSYLSRAVSELISMRARMADNLRDENLRVGKMAVRAKYGSGIGGLSEAGTSCVVEGW
jgi:transitional endoplasmic reticulum ATPase